MTEEIKEILNYIDDRIIPNEKWDKIKDYITNLQQAIEIKNQRIKEEQQEKERYIKSYNGLNTWNKELKQENEKLKEEIDILKSNFEVEIDDCENYKKWYRDYKSRCEKAIDILLCYGETFDSKIHQEMQEKLLNILNGSDE